MAAVPEFWKAQYEAELCYLRQIYALYFITLHGRYPSVKSSGPLKGSRKCLSKRLVQPRTKPTHRTTCRDKVLSTKLRVHKSLRTRIDGPVTAYRCQLRCSRAWDPIVMVHAMMSIFSQLTTVHCNRFQPLIHGAVSE